jgi:hypothetical protein
MDEVGEKTRQAAGGSTLCKIEGMDKENSENSKREIDAHR